MENSSGGRNISAEEVISKLKDDGDFDQIRLKIIRKLKEDEELRNTIISIVKQSAAINRPGAENMKPRQLSDAIHQEVGDKVMNEISDGVWRIIKSADGMKNEITETVHSVYGKLLNPKVEEKESSRVGEQSIERTSANTGRAAASSSEFDGTLSEGEPDEPPPGFGPCAREKDTNNAEGPPKQDHERPMSSDTKVRENLCKKIHLSEDSLEQDSKEAGAPPGFPTMKRTQPYDSGDEDFDAPPGFG